MKFDVDKFVRGQNGSGYFHKWDEHLLKMNDALKALPTYEDGGETWYFHPCKKASFIMGFKKDGELFVDVRCKRYKDPNKPVLNNEEVASVVCEVMRVINIFDEFGFIIH